MRDIRNRYLKPQICWLQSRPGFGPLRYTELVKLTPRHFCPTARSSCQVAVDGFCFQMGTEAVLEYKVVRNFTARFRERGELLSLRTYLVVGASAQLCCQTAAS